MQLSRPARIALRAAAGLGFAFIYVPLALVLVNSFNRDRSASWPPSGLTLHWWSAAWENEGPARRCGCRSRPGSAPRRSRSCSAR